MPNPNTSAIIANLFQQVMQEPGAVDRVPLITPDAEVETISSDPITLPRPAELSDSGRRLTTAGGVFESLALALGANIRPQAFQGLEARRREIEDIERKEALLNIQQEREDTREERTANRQNRRDATAQGIRTRERSQDRLAEAQADFRRIRIAQDAEARQRTFQREETDRQVNLGITSEFQEVHGAGAGNALKQMGVTFDSNGDPIMTPDVRAAVTASLGDIKRDREAASTRRSEDRINNQALYRSHLEKDERHQAEVDVWIEGDPGIPGKSPPVTPVAEQIRTAITVAARGGRGAEGERVEAKQGPELAAAVGQQIKAINQIRARFGRLRKEGTPEGGALLEDLYRNGLAPQLDELEGQAREIIRVVVRQQQVEGQRQIEQEAQIRRNIAQFGTRFPGFGGPTSPANRIGTLIPPDQRPRSAITEAIERAFGPGADTEE